MCALCDAERTQRLNESLERGLPINVGEPMSAPETWVECPTCKGHKFLGEFEHVDPYTGEHLGNELIPCPDCVDGLVPSDGEVEAAAAGMWDSHGMDYSIKQARRDVLPDYLVMARAALVAARRYQRKAEKQ